MNFKQWLESTIQEWVINPDTGLPMAAGVLPVCRSTGRILPNFRGKTVADGGTISTWGGALDEGETPETAVKREIQEEAGYAGPISNDSSLRLS